MKNKLRELVLLFLKQPPKDKYERFNKAFDLYKQSQGKSVSVEAKLNRAGFTEEGLQNLIYDLQKLHDISDAEVASKKGLESKEEFIPETSIEELEIQISMELDRFNALVSAEIKDEIEISKQALKVFSIHEEYVNRVISKETIALQSIEDELCYLDTQKPKDLKLIDARKKVFEAKKNDIQSFVSKSKEFIKMMSVENYISSTTSNTEKEEIPGNSENSENEIGKTLSEKVIDFVDPTLKLENPLRIIDSEEIIPIRDEFPFLNDKDCPEIMFVVVGKRISAYRRYQELHGKLQEALANEGSLTPEEQSALAAETQEANAENIALWDELKHYAEHGEILGKHPLFKESVAKKEVETMTTEELAKFRTSSATFISKKKKALEAKGVTEEKKAELEQAIKDRQFKLSLVNAKLGIADDKK